VLPARFKVTPKGEATSPDRLWTFRIHLFWALIFGGALAASTHTGYSYPAMRVWTGIALFTSLLPMLLWIFAAMRGRRRTSVSVTSEERAAA
jgi:hypothetical protein